MGIAARAAGLKWSDGLVDCWIDEVAEGRALAGQSPPAKDNGGRRWRRGTSGLLFSGEGSIFLNDAQAGVSEGYEYEIHLRKD